mgnify:CR=1 FL=1
MAKDEENRYLDARILTEGCEIPERTRRDARSRVRKALKELPEWADDFRLLRRNGGSLTKQLRHRDSTTWISVLNKYTQTIVKNLDLGLWATVYEDGQRVYYICAHGFKGSRSIRELSQQTGAVGGCPTCLNNAHEPVFGTLTRKRRKWESGLSDPQAPCYFYMHKLSDGSFIYGVSASNRLQRRMDQYKEAMGYTPRVVYLALATEREMWSAEEVLKKGITRGLNHDCEARRTSGGRTEYLPETYTTAKAVALVMEAHEIVQ